MADLPVSFSLPSAKVNEYVAHYIYVHKNTETKDDPNWVDPGDGSKAPQIPKYTDKAWTREHIIRTVRRQVIRGRTAKYINDITNYNADDIS